MDWKDKARELRFDKGLSYGNIARELKDCFPELDLQQIYEKVKKYIRNTPEYKQEKKFVRIKGAEEKQLNADTTFQSVSSEYKADGTRIFEDIIKLTEEGDITPELIMQGHHLSIDDWDVVSYKSNFWQAQGKDSEKVLLYQSKITVKPKSRQGITLKDIEAHFEEFKSTYKPVKREYKFSQNNKLIEVTIADLHLGKLCWNAETGENYDYKIAKQRFFEVICQNEQLIKQVKPERILFSWCNDFFNTDTPDNKTTKGTPQDNDVRQKKMILVGYEMLVEAIEIFAQYAPVDTFVIMSNHSEIMEFCALLYIKAWFRNDNQVNVIVNCMPRYYYEYGKCLIGFSHSSFEANKNFGELMSVEVPEMWARTKYREMHLGHLHTEKLKNSILERGGVVCRWLPSCTGTDMWHAGSGYIGSIKRSQTFIWDRENGLESINIISVKV